MNLNLSIYDHCNKLINSNSYISSKVATDKNITKSHVKLLVKVMEEKRLTHYTNDN